MRYQMQSAARGFCVILIKSLALGSASRREGDHHVHVTLLPYLQARIFRRLADKLLREYHPYIHRLTCHIAPANSLLIPSVSSPTTSSFHTIFCDALKRYCEKTKNDLLTHPLTTDLQNCKHPTDFLAVFEQKYNVRGFIQSQCRDQMSMQWLNTTFLRYRVPLAKGLDW
jgi:hypothetical protein